MSVIVITGAGSGLGMSAAIALAKRNHIVYATAPNDYGCDLLRKCAIDKDIPLKIFKLDILNEDDRLKLLEIDFDCLINNAAIGDSGSVSEVDVTRFENVYNTNVFASIKLTQIALKKLISKGYGRVIFVSSLIGRIPMAFLAPYCSSKFAIEGFATCLRKEMKKLDNANIQIGIIEPGAYATGFNQRNCIKQYEWMSKNSYFKYKWKELKKVEDKKWSFLERKKYNSIIRKYIQSVENKKVKHRYVAPFFQGLITKIGIIFGF